MKNFSIRIFSLIVVLMSFTVYSQPITGTKTVGGGGSPDYATLEAAIAALNVNGTTTPGVTFNVADGHTETFSSISAGLVTTQTGTASSPIVFQRAPGSTTNPKITAALGGVSTTRDGIIVITGGDYITFDGIDIQENSGNTTAQNQMEWGYALIKASKTPPVNGCDSVVIKNCTITLNKSNANSAGIYSGNHTSDTTSTLTLSETSDIMRNCVFSGNNISAVNYGMRLTGSTNRNYIDSATIVDGNIITNFGGGSSSTYGMEIQYQADAKIMNNVINGGSGGTGAVYGIRTGSATNTNLDIFKNTVTLIQSGTNLIYGITNSTGSSGVSNAVNIYENTIENCQYPTSSTNSVWLLYNLASCANLNIYGNLIRNNTKTAGTGPMHCIFNSPTSPTINAQIYGNRIYNNSSAGIINGINIDDGTTNRVFKNEIFNLSTSSTTAVVSGILLASGPINTYIYNNLISDLKALSSSTDNAVRGINITSTTANSNIGLYYNSIYLNASTGGGTTGIYHTNSTTATTAVLDMRNNIVVNKSTTSGRTVAFRRSAANVNLNNYSTLSNNNAFYAGTPSTNNLIFYDGTNSDQTMVQFKTRVAPRETNSLSENVPFLNSTTPPYDLHMSEVVATQVESGGLPITSPVNISDDFDNVLRNATNPDIGADEFNGIAADFTAPSINYTALGNTTTTSNPTLSGVVITDGSGINVTSGTAPRIYYKKYSDANTYAGNTATDNGWKWTESTTGSSPFSFTIDYSKLFGGTGAVAGDTIQYFVVAQDNASPANVGINSGSFAATPSSVNLTSAAFPLSGSINSYRILMLISGDVTVGNGGTYPTLTGPKGLFVRMNENIVFGDITAKVISDVTEPGTYALDQWPAATYSLTINPDTAIVRTLSGSYTGGLIRLNGADNVKIDGRFNITGNYLAFQNTSTNANTAAIQIISLGTGAGSFGNTIRNLDIKAGVNSVSSSFGIFIGGASISTSGSGADNNAIAIVENTISKCRFGIYARGTSSNPMNSLYVYGNVIGSNTADDYVTEYGINVQAASAPQILNNEVFNMIYEISKYPIWFGSNVSNAIVSKNKVHSIDQTGTGGFNSLGIIFSSNTGCTDNQIDNNMIYDIRTYGSTSAYLAGIRIVGGTNYKVYYNTVSITGAFGSATSGLWSACLHIPTTGSTNMDVRNNIFSNTRTGNSPKSYTVHSLATTSFTQLNYNNYWTNGSIFGYYGADIADFSTWKSTLGKDANSTNVSVTFVSSTDAHLSGGSIGDPYLAGIPIAGLTTDIDNEVRNATYPYKGADESTPFTVYTLNLNALIEGFYTPSVEAMVPDTVTVELRNSTSPWGLVDKAKTVLNASGLGSLNYLFPQDATNYYLVVKHRNSIETWSKNPQSFSGASLTYDFTTDSAKAYGDNMKKKGIKWCIYSGDVNQDGVIDITDVSSVDTDNLNFVTGYVVTDVNGDNLVDISDVSLADLNNLNFVSKVTPTFTAKPIKIEVKLLE